MNQPTIVIIPGIGDELRVYRLFAARWRRRGYKTYVIPFGWFEYSARLQPKLEAFYKRLDKLEGDHFHLIGVSAGGPAAIIAFAQRSDVHKVITVSSPLDTLPGLRNPLLAEAIEQARSYLHSFTASQKQRILSVHGIADHIVATNISKPEGVPTQLVPMVAHAPAIFVALMLYVRSLETFLKR